MQETTTAEDDAAALEHVVRLQQQRELGALFAHKCLSVALWTGGALVLSLGLNGWLGWRVAHPPTKYFTTEHGRVTQVYPLDQPAYSLNDIAAFGADAIRDSFTLNFVQYRNQMTAVQPRYSEAGFRDYYQALTRSNVLIQVRDKRMNLSVDVEPGVIRSKGIVGGIYAWEYQYPVTLKLDGQQSSSLPLRFIFTLRVQRADERQKPAGLEVTQVITTPAG